MTERTGADRSAAVGVRAQGSEPALHVLPRDVGDVYPAEPWKDLVAQIVPVDPAGSGLPVPPVPLKDLLGDRLEELPFLNDDRFVAPDCGEHFRCAPATLLKVDTLGVADGLPEAPSLVLAVNEVTFGSRRQDADAEAFQFGVTDVVWRLAGFEGLDPGPGEADIGHGFSSCVL